MCKSIAEGGIRCAHHTRPQYLDAIKEFKKTKTPSSMEELSIAATKYAATPSGAKAIETSILSDTTDDNLKDLLADALVRGRAEYAENKALTAEIENRARGAAISEWCRALPSSPEADKAYRNQLASDLDLDEESFSFAWAVAETEFDAMEEKDLTFLPARYLIQNSQGSVFGTPISPTYLATAANFEKLAAYARKQKRNRQDHKDAHGTLWIRYENDTLSEVLRSVDYDPESARLTVGLATDQPSGTIFYTYKDVSSDLVEHLCSARSMGRFYAHVFSSSSDGGSFAGRTLEDYAFVKHTSNNLLPTSYSAGPVPKGIHEKLAHRVS